MTSLFHATLDATSLAPPQPPGMLRAIGLALLAHALLIAALTWGVHWNQQESPAVEAEIWSTATQQAAPRAIEPLALKPEPVLPPPPAHVAPPVKAEPATPPPDLAVREAQIALEREKKRREVAQQRERELAEREQQQRKASLDKKRQDQEQQKLKEAQARKEAEAKARKEADAKAQAQAQAQARKTADAADAKRKAAVQEQAQKAQQEQEAEARRQANLKRMQGLAGASGGPDATGSALQSTGPSSSFGARVNAKVLPNIVFPDNIPGNPTADVEVRCAPDGTVTSRRLVKSSGNSAWDEAVLRAIDKTVVMPRDVDGRVHPSFTIGFRPKSG